MNTGNVTANPPTLTLGVSAFNEEGNIRQFLNSVLKQRTDGFVLERILVISDGSTDRTNAIVKSFSGQAVELRARPERLGKSARLNELYAEVTSDILVQSDADVVFGHPDVLHDLIQPMLNDQSIALCGGHPTPVRGSTFTEKAVNVTFDVYAPLRGTLRGGNNVLSVAGSLLAYRKDLIKRMRMPDDMIANDVYTYFYCLKEGYRYAYVSSAVVYFRSPQTLKDQIRQNTRFVSAPARMAKYFSPSMVHRECNIPLTTLIPRMLAQFVRHPLLSSYIFTVNMLCRVRSKFVEKKLTARWSTAHTTKKLPS